MSSNLVSSPSDILSKNKKKSILLSKVEIHNGDDFTNNYYTKLLSPLLADPTFTLDQFISQCNFIYKNFDNTGLFSKINFSIAEDNEAAATLALPKPIEKEEILPIKAIIDLQTKKLVNFNIDSVFFDNGHLFNFKYENLNCFGNGEKFQAKSQVDFRDNLKLIDLQFKNPLNPSTNLFLNSSSSNRSNSWASHEQILFNSMIGIENSSTHLLANVRTSILGALAFNRRTITNVNDSASDIIKSNSGDSLKKSFLLSGSWDSRSYLSPQSLFPVNGSLLKIDNEISSDEDNGNFMKSVVKTQFLKNFLNNNLIFAIDGSVGGIVSLSSKQKKLIHIQDKFFQGGLSSLQGFQLNSTGLKDGNDYIGGNIFYNFKFSTIYNLPFIKNSSSNPLRVVNFINFGDVLQDLKSLDSKRGSVSDFLLNQNSTNVGVGLLYKFGNDLHLNLNYNIPISTRVNDLLKPGLEFSLSIASDF